jgi:hypothetical protein
MEFNVTLIVEAVISLCVALISAFLIPWVKKKVGAEKMTEFLQWVDIGVAAAEQVYASDATREKKDYVLDFLDEKGIVYDRWAVDAAIEAAVIKLHAQLYTKEGEAQ